MGEQISDKFIILSDDGYWNNDIGWCQEYEGATKFDYFDRNGRIIPHNLPVGNNVRWIWANDNRQWKSFDDYECMDIDTMNHILDVCDISIALAGYKVVERDETYLIAPKDGKCFEITVTECVG